MPCVDMRATGNNIKTMCERRGVRVSDITEKIGISKVAVYKWFNGTAVPSIDNMVILASIFKVKIDDIIVTRMVA